MTKTPLTGAERQAAYLKRQKEELQRWRTSPFYDLTPREEAHLLNALEVFRRKVAASRM